MENLFDWVTITNYKFIQSNSYIRLRSQCHALTNDVEYADLSFDILRNLESIQQNIHSSRERRPLQFGNRDKYWLKVWRLVFYCLYFPTTVDYHNNIYYKIIN